MVARYVPKARPGPRRPPSTRWSAFFRTHLAGALASDLLTVPTVTFRMPYVFLLLSLQRRVLPHVNE